MKKINWYNLPDRVQEKLIPGKGINISKDNVIDLTEVETVWGSISGNIQDQTDIISLINEKILEIEVDDKIENVKDWILTNLPSTELPLATSSTLGGVKIGSNLSIDGNGVLSATSSTPTLKTINSTSLIGTGNLRLVANNGSGDGVYLGLCNGTGNGTSARSFALGESTVTNSAAGILGWNCKTGESYAIATGYNTSALHMGSFTVGMGTQSRNAYHFVVGAYNDTNVTPAYPIVGHDSGTFQLTRPLFTVGNGNDFVRSNAYQLYADGRSEQKKDFEIQTIGQGVVLRSPDNSKWRITVDDLGNLITTKL